MDVGDKISEMGAVGITVSFKMISLFINYRGVD
jgi:hypothetical protein